MALLSLLPLLLILFSFSILLLPSSLVAQPSSPALHPGDLAALLQVRNSLTDLRGSDFFASWDFTSTDPCSSFAGLICAADPDNASVLRVSSLTLGTGLADSQGLAGTLPSTLSAFSQLAQLVVNPGKIAGTIPESLGSVPSLRFLSITNNLLSGVIPHSLANLSSLHTLDLSYNSLQGAVPPDVIQLPALKVLILAANDLSGPVPPIGSQLLHLDLRSNTFSGTLPAQLPSSLRYLSASGNAMWGPLNGLRALADLQFLDLSMNQLNGSIPDTLFADSPQLSTVLLQRNALSGPIPTIPAVGSLSTVDLSHNMLTGKVPPVLAGADSVYLNNNHLSGAVPEDYVRSVYNGNMKTLYLQHNYLSAFPLPVGSPPPESAALCLSYNCMDPPVAPLGCPASAGGKPSRPPNQCAAFNRTAPTIRS